MIRYAKPSDFDFFIEGVEQIRAIEGYPNIKATKADKKEAKTAIKRKEVRVLEINGKVIGYLYFRTDFKIMYEGDDFLWIQRIFIKKGYRKKGYGKLLHKDIMKYAKKKRLKRVLCDVYNTNNNSKKFHKKVGFSPRYTIFEKDVC